MAIMDEHAPRNKYSSEEKDHSEPELTDEQKKLVKTVNKIFDKNKKHRSKFDKNWAIYYRFYRGQQWNVKRPKYRNSEVLNFVFQDIQSQVPTMTDARPKITFVPVEPSDQEFADIMNTLLSSDWEGGNWLYKLTEVLYDGHFYGTGHSSLEVIDDEGIPVIRFKSEDTFDMYPDSEAEDVNECSDNFIKARPYDIDKLKKRYAKHEWVSAIKSDMDDLTKRRRDIDIIHFKRNTNLDIATSSPTFSTDDVTENNDKVLVLEAYFKPDDVEEEKIEQLNEETGECKTLYVSKLKYPKGRRVVIINDIPFEDEPNPYDHGRFPYQKYVNYTLPREYWGMGEVEQLKGPQETFNKLISFAVDVAQLMGNPIWLIPTGSNVNESKLINKPGLAIPYDGPEPPRRAEGVQLQPFVLQLVDRYEKYFNSIAGEQDVSRGINPAGVTANSAIENLLDQAQKRVKLKMRNMDAWLRNVGKDYVDLVLQYYTTPRVFRVTSKGTGALKYFKFHIVKEVDENGDVQNVAHVREFRKDGTNSDTVKKIPLKGRLDVEVNTSSGLPFNKAEKEQKLLALFDRGILDERAVLEGIEFPDVEKTLQRLEQRRQEMAAQQQQQGA